MNEGKERDAHDELSPSKSDRHGTEPVSVPENADFRYDEQEAPDAVNEGRRVEGGKDLPCSSSDA